MSPFSGPEPRRLAGRIALAQLAVTAGIAAICMLGWGREHAGSALAGGLIGTVANLFMAVALFRQGGSANRALGLMYLGQLAKIGFTVAMLFVVARTSWVQWPPLLAAYIGALATFWWVPFAAARRAVRSGG